MKRRSAARARGAGSCAIIMAVAISAAFPALPARAQQQQRPQEKPTVTLPSLTAQGFEIKSALDPDVIVYRISGAFFFGAAASVAAALDRIGEHPKAYVVDFSAVSVIDSTAAATIEGFVRKARRHQALVYVTGAQPAVRHILLSHGVRPPDVRFAQNIDDAMTEARASSANETAAVSAAEI
jgi:sulfate permease, SulP family